MVLGKLLVGGIIFIPGQSLSKNDNNFSDFHFHALKNCFVICFLFGVNNVFVFLYVICV